ncbi:P-loop containing nucleoside triphosphate hydrolases superfamily protein [Arabidopsis thaliana]|uniref:ATPase GET3B n=1 Tax=Arabidopsis thaliana TaxID=3702 RepID=GET3B_ARATH|nr:P-loop containing nucleoside triphosphate hydrolases superfamily protein [Arabidopsis thaliana]A1L4Y1.1 RecName: Full=ATPase GET3B; Short=AtGET3B; AltName: Full=Guided entry of tail-anchored proteins 3 homolog B; Flags: Precursor [Arabidopsis thaliana]ABM06038.1 At3g10350 [Arabidopsis thaliana]AEE74894.1 P-loop containing nucleoside triphosphate hydrolases superfamily protein [Arabidopsis thaliana]|eukprot:NP_187646.2 P-loop containing nucleoside triphosphate hydrolases superfamily protein [Arabidopsis thaliana]
MATLSSYLLSSPPLCKSRFSATSLVSGIDFISFSPRTTLSSSSTVLPAILSLSVKHNRRRNSLQVKSVASPTETISEFDEMVSGTKRKYYMLGGKGGVGKTSCAASLAVRFANNGHPTLVVSTDPAHSLSDSFAQDLTGGMLVPVEGPEAPLFALEINPEKAREEFRSASQMNGGTGVKDFMDGMGLGMLVEQLGELKLGELLDTPPPGLDEAIAISKVIQFLESPEYNMFTRIVFDTAPTGHTLRLLSLPDFLDASIGKILKLRQKITSATSAIKSVFGKEEKGPDAADKLEKLRERMVKVRELFRDTESTEFVIVTIPTVMAVSESSRLSASLKKESVPVKRLIVNQLLPPSSSDCKFCSIKRKDQMRALDMIREDSELSALTLMEAPLVDMEIRGVPALRFLGDIIWK